MRTSPERYKPLETLDLAVRDARESLAALDNRGAHRDTIAALNAALDLLAQLDRAAVSLADQLEADQARDDRDDGLDAADDDRAVLGFVQTEVNAIR